MNDPASNPAKRELENTNELLGRILGEGVINRKTAISIVHQIFFNRDVIVFIEKGKVP